MGKYRSPWFAKALSARKVRPSDFGLKNLPVFTKSEEPTSEAPQEPTQSSEQPSEQPDESEHTSEESQSTSPSTPQSTPQWATEHAWVVGTTAEGHKVKPEQLATGQRHGGGGRVGKPAAMTDEEYIQNYLDTMATEKKPASKIPENIKQAVIDEYRSDPQFATARVIANRLSHRKNKLSVPIAVVWDILDESGVEQNEPRPEQRLAANLPTREAIIAGVNALGDDYTIAELRKRLVQHRRQKISGMSRDEFTNMVQELVREGKVPPPREMKASLEENIINRLEKYPTKERIGGLAAIFRRPVEEVEQAVRSLGKRGLLSGKEVNRLLSGVDKQAHEARIDDRIASTIRNWNRRDRMTVASLADNYRRQMSKDGMKAALRRLANRGDDIGEKARELLGI